MDRYEVLHHLGAGSFGNVAVGRDKATNLKVALKFIGKVKLDSWNNNA